MLLLEVESLWLSGERLEKVREERAAAPPSPVREIHNVKVVVHLHPP